MAVDQDKLNEFMGKAVSDIGATLSANMVLLGDKLGLYKAMVALGPVTPAELAKATKRQNGIPVNGYAIRQQAAMCPMRLELVDTGSLKNRPWPSSMKAVHVFSPAHFKSLRPHFQVIPRSINGSRPARVSGGISTTTGCLKARKDFSARITWATS